MGSANQRACGRQGRVADTGRVVRPAATADLRRIQEIETAAGELFRALGMDAVADDPPPTVEQLSAYVAAGTAWVAADPAGDAIGYILIDAQANGAHIEQVTVHPRHVGFVAEDSDVAQGPRRAFRLSSPVPVKQPCPEGTIGYLPGRSATRRRTSGLEGVPPD